MATNGLGRPSAKSAIMLRRQRLAMMPPQYHRKLAKLIALAEQVKRKRKDRTK